MSEGGGGRRVGQIIRRHIHGLERGDRAGAGRGDALLQATHFVGQRRLVAHRGRHPAQQRGHFGAGQGVTIDVIDEQQHVAAFVAEVLGHGQAGQRHAHTIARRLVHLAVDQRDLVEHAAFFHLVIEVVAFTGPLPDAGEHRETRVRHRDVADQLHQGHGLADTGAAEQADLAALGDRHDQVDHLDPGFENFHRGGLVGIRRRLAVNRHVGIGIDRAHFVDRRTQHVHDPAQGGLANRNQNRIAGRQHLHAAAQAVGGAHRNRPHDAVAQLLLDFHRQFRRLHFQRFEDPRHGVT